jgi:hypothetical protein
MQLLCENGNQRKYKISAKEFLNKPMSFPPCQRSISEEHVMEIVAFQQQHFAKKSHYFFLNCIQVCSVNGVWYCVDGQHRYSALKLLNDLPDWFIDIEVIHCEDEKEMKEIFFMINKNTPLPGFLKEEGSREIANDFKKYIQGKYPRFVSASSKPQRPNIHLDTFIDDMNKFKHPPARLVELVAWFEEENNEHRDYLLNSNNEQCQKLMEKINSVTKTRNGDKLYLGCFWLDSIPNKISKITREKCWKLWSIECNTKSVDQQLPCYVCEEWINAFNFEAGHIESHATGGTNALENLRPVCNKCNKRVGTKNMNEYKNTM